MADLDRIADTRLGVTYPVKRARSAKALRERKREREKEKETGAAPGFGQALSLNLKRNCSMRALEFFTDYSIALSRSKIGQGPSRHVFFNGEAHFKLAMEWQLWHGLRAFPDAPL